MSGAGGFRFTASISRWVDADTVIVDPSVFPMDVLLRIRLRDVYAPEAGEEGEADLRAKAESDFPPGSRIAVSGEAARWSFNRLVARIDPA